MVGSHWANQRASRQLVQQQIRDACARFVQRQSSDWPRNSRSLHERFGLAMCSPGHPGSCQLPENGTRRQKSRNCGLLYGRGIVLGECQFSWGNRCIGAILWHWSAGRSCFGKVSVAASFRWEGCIGWLLGHYRSGFVGE